MGSTVGKHRPIACVRWRGAHRRVVQVREDADGVGDGEGEGLEGVDLTRGHEGTETSAEKSGQVS